MKVLYIQPMKAPEVVEIKNDYRDMQKLVDGLIEPYYPFKDEIALVVNDEGKINGMPPNRSIRNKEGEIIDIVFGPFFIAGTTIDDFCSLTNEQIEKYTEMFKYAEIFLKGERI